MSLLRPPGMGVPYNASSQALTPAGWVTQRGYFTLPIQALMNGEASLVNQGSGDQFLANNNRNIWRFDLTGFTEFVLTARVVTGSASANNPRIMLRYRTTFSTTIGDWSSSQNIGTSEGSCSMASAGVIQSAWVPLVSGAKADVFIACIQNGGDGTADPALANVYAVFR